MHDNINKPELGKQVLENIEKYNKDLRARAKTLEELTIPVLCLVESIVGSASKIHHTPHSEMVYGGTTPSYHTGDALKTEISVKTSTPVTKIIFGGWPPIEKGDLIKAYIIKAKEEYEKLSFNIERLFCYQQHRQPTPLYVERDFKNEETAIKIEKLKNDVIVATYIN